MQQHRV
ncbi:BgTH12-05079 [Blumeria graminis f. sp. triticale]|nr:BgTH12-05079 [Blumeria graminis f. sp. triticale]